jgi:hypothetical protein
MYSRCYLNVHSYLSDEITVKANKIFLVNVLHFCRMYIIMILKYFVQQRRCVNKHMTHMFDWCSFFILHVYILTLSKA